LSSKPKAYWRQSGNYNSYTDHSDKGAAELLRLVEGGVVEGPLHYQSHVVNPQGGGVAGGEAEVADHLRFDCFGCEQVTLPVDECRYDMLDEMLPKQLPFLKDLLGPRGVAISPCPWSLFWLVMKP
jgi:hypothetical protein